MATMTLTWKDLNIGEDGFNIYRSEAPMDINNMPTPIATLGPNVGSYDDTTGVNGTLYYYRVGVLKDSEEKISGEFARVFGDSVNVHDVFGDGSAVATYKFDGDTIDLGGNYNGSWSGTESYETGIIGNAIRFTGSNGLDIPLSGPIEAFSFWVKNYITGFGDDSARNPLLFNKANQRELFSFGDLGSKWSGETFCIYGDSSSDVLYATSHLFDSDEWYHVVITWDDTVGTYAIYHNCIQVPTIGSCRKLSFSGATLGYRPEYSQYGNMALDQLRFFNRPLTEEQIRILYYEA